MAEFNQQIQEEEQLEAMVDLLTNDIQCREEELERNDYQSGDEESKGDGNRSGDEEYWKGNRIFSPTIDEDTLQTTQVQQVVLPPSSKSEGVHIPQNKPAMGGAIMDKGPRAPRTYEDGRANLCRQLQDQRRGQICAR